MFKFALLIPWINNISQCATNAGYIVAPLTIWFLRGSMFLITLPAILKAKCSIFTARYLRGKPYSNGIPVPMSYKFDSYHLVHC